MIVIDGVKLTEKQFKELIHDAANRTTETYEVVKEYLDSDNKEVLEIYFADHKRRQCIEKNELKLINEKGKPNFIVSLN